MSVKSMSPDYMKLKTIEFSSFCIAFTLTQGWRKNEELFLTKQKEYQQLREEDSAQIEQNKHIRLLYFLIEQLQTLSIVSKPAQEALSKLSEMAPKSYEPCANYYIQLRSNQIQNISRIVQRLLLPVRSTLTKPEDPPTGIKFIRDCILYTVQEHSQKAELAFKQKIIRCQKLVSLALKTDPYDFDYVKGNESLEKFKEHHIKMIDYITFFRQTIYLLPHLLPLSSNQKEDVYLLAEADIAIKGELKKMKMLYNQLTQCIHQYPYPSESVPLTLENRSIQKKSRALQKSLSTPSMTANLEKISKFPISPVSNTHLPTPSPSSSTSSSSSSVASSSLSSLSTRAPESLLRSESNLSVVSEAEKIPLTKKTTCLPATKPTSPPRPKKVSFWGRCFILCCLPEG